MIVDIQNIATIVASPVIAAATAIWVFRHQQREKLAASTGWTKVRGYTGPEDAPCVHLQNRSAIPAAVIKVGYRYGFLGRKRSNGTALDYEDPDDLRFPYAVEPGKTISLVLDERQAVRIAGEAGALARVASRIGRPRFWIEVKTIAGSTILISGEALIPWKERPAWLQRW